MANVSIITIGDELLIGQVIDTNSAWMAKTLNKYGFAVLRRVAVGDNKKAITEALDEESRHAEIILITGGLGPTADDITKPLLCTYFGGKMITDVEALKNVKHLFAHVFNRPITERNLLQAQVPDVCTVLQNPAGTAPGMLFEKNKNVFVSMPGVPHEMQALMEEKVIPYLLRKFSMQTMVHRTLLTYGIGESSLADMIQDFEENLPDHIKLAYLPNYGTVRLRLSATGKDERLITQEMDTQFSTLTRSVQKFLVVDEDLSMQEVVGKMLLSRNETMSTAESCTGGYIAHLLTTIPGSSSWYDGSVVSYSYGAKEDLLQVKKSSLLEYGAVSEEIVREMAEGALQNIHATYTIAVSGIMGPAGGMADKPVGTVWVAVGDKHSIVCKKFYFRFGRQKNIELTAMNALNLLRTFIIKKYR